MLYVAGNTHDRDPLNVRVTRPSNSFSKRVFILEILSHECFVRDADEWRFLIEVLWTKISSLLERDLHDLEVVAQHAASFQTRLVTGRYRRPVFDQKIVIERVAAEWKLADHRGLHARQ